MKLIRSTSTDPSIGTPASNFSLSQCVSIMQAILADIGNSSIKLVIVDRESCQFKPNAVHRIELKVSGRFVAAVSGPGENRVAVALFCFERERRDPANVFE